MPDTPYGKTRRIRVDSQHPEPHLIAEAAELLRQGEIVAFPTETVYGLGANALNPEAVAKIFTAKGRPADNPLIVHTANVEMARGLTSGWNKVVELLAQKFMPGPLTLVLPKLPEIPNIVTAGGDTVAIRIPRHPVAQALLHAANLPIAAPSANRSTLTSPTTADHVLKSLEGRIPLVIDGGSADGGIESTVLHLGTDPPTILRPGLITIEELQDVLGIVQTYAPININPNISIVASPGLKHKHYAPRSPLYLVNRLPDDYIDSINATQIRVGLITHRRLNQPLPANLSLYQMPPTPEGYASQLYTALHTLDDTGAALLLVESPPEAPDWLAIHDRLNRAAKEILNSLPPIHTLLEPSLQSDT